MCVYICMYVCICICIYICILSALPQLCVARACQCAPLAPHRTHLDARCCNVERTEGRFPNWTIITADISLVGRTPF